MSSDNIWLSFEELVKKEPRKAAIIYLGTKYTYTKLKYLAESFASSLSDIGVKKEDRIVIYAPNSPQWIVAFLGIQRIGAIAVPITPIYTPPDVSFICNNCDAKLILCSDTNLGYVLQILPETSLEHIIVTGVADILPAWKRFIGRAFNKIPGGRIPALDKLHTFRQVIRPGKTDKQFKVTSKSEDTCAIMYTGGTMGFPKGVPISHAAFLENLYWVKKAKESVLPPEGDVVLQGAPLFHILGLGGGLISPLCLGGDTVLLPPRVNLDGLMDWTQRYKATSLFAVPSFYRMLLEHDRAEQYNLNSLQYCLTGGDVVPAELQKQWFAKYGKPLYQAFGITEAGGAVSLSFADEDNPEGSAGRILPCNETRLVIPGTLEQVPKDEPGELLLSSKYGPKRYWNSPEDTEESFVQADGKIWYRTKDIIKIDENGYLFFVDREADLIKHKGYRIAAAEIERILQEHPAVIAACAIGIPDAKVGERIKAFAVLKEDIRGLSAQELISWCRGKLAAYKVPEYIEFRDSLPKSKVGKLLRREIRSYERKKVE